jgi:para-aminobenzoate synthetase component 1
MLEIHEANGAFDQVEAYLRSHGFITDDGAGADGLCADLYLGYGLSSTLRRTADDGPPEPTALPLAACRVRRADEALSTGGYYEVGEWATTWDVSSYARAVAQVRDAIAEGEIYQANLVQHLSAPFAGQPDGLVAAFAHLDPLVPRALHGDGWSIVSASPELFLSRRGRHVRTMPIKGTRPLGDDVALRASAKDAAEHVMIVDLERNDLGRICEPGSVHWPSLMSAREMAGVVHLVSIVEGDLRPEVGWAQTLAALFPGGSITGAPKVAAIDHIAALEPVGRGASMGALGTVWPNGDLELALTIRTFAIADGRIHLWVGGGIVWDSQPSAEIAESWVKARPLLDALTASDARHGAILAAPALIG